MDEAKDRHPTAWRPDMARMRLRMATLLANEGASHPHVAASALAVRGALGMDLQCFASLLDLEEATVVAVERGSVAATAVPQSMRSWIDPAELTP